MSPFSHSPHFYPSVPVCHLQDVLIIVWRVILSTCNRGQCEGGKRQLRFNSPKRRTLLSKDIIDTPCIGLGSLAELISSQPLRGPNEEILSFLGLNISVESTLFQFLSLPPVTRSTCIHIHNLHTLDIYFTKSLHQTVSPALLLMCKQRSHDFFFPPWDSAGPPAIPFYCTWIQYSRLESFLQWR